MVKRDQTTQSSVFCAITKSAYKQIGIS